MNAETVSRSKIVIDLRRDFDQTFAVAPTSPVEENESLITLRVAGEALAVRKLHITGVARRKRILPIPTLVPGLLGITAIRGALFPIYDFASLLELTAPAGEGLWLMLTNPEAPIGLVFDEFEGQMEIERACLYESDSSGSRKHRRLMAKVGAAHRAVIDIPGIVEEIRKAAGVLEPVKE